MMDIRFITRKWPPAVGGMETYCLRITDELAKSHAVDVVALQGNEDGSVPGMITLLRFGVSSFWYLLLSEKRSVVHLGDMSIWPFALAVRLRLHGSKLVISAHGTDVSYPRRGGVAGRLYGAYLKLGALLLPGITVVANSRTTAQCVQTYGFSNIEIVPLATDSVHVDNDVGHTRSLLFAGRLTKRKGLKWFVENVLSELSDDINLRVAGTLWDAQEAAALSSSRVEFLGPLSKNALNREYRSALAVVVPNIQVDNGEFEGFGLVAPEAAAAGGVVLASSQDGLQEAVKNHKTGFLLPSGVAVDWIDKIQDIIRWSANDRNEFIDASKKYVEVHYSWERVAEDTALLYQ